MQDIGQGRPLTCDVVIEALSRAIPPQRVEEVLAQTRGKRAHRVRKVPMVGTVWLVVAIGLFGDLDTSAIWRQVAGTLRTLWAALAQVAPPVRSALAQARRRLGARAMRALFKLTATTAARADDDDAGRGGGGVRRSSSPGGGGDPPAVSGAFYRGMRLVGLDGQKLTVPDTPANAKAFGRCQTRRGAATVAAGYPQVLLMRLVELGTHLCLEALVKPARHGESPVAAYLLKKAPPDALMLWDCAFYSYKLLRQATAEQGIQLLGRLPATPIFEPVERLDDDSTLAYVYPDPWARRRGDRSRAILVRVIRYTLDDPDRPGHGQAHRLVTTLLDARRYPASELILLYHQRWELEIDNDELTTHQLARPVDLRSRTPVGVVQELYGVMLAHNAIRRTMVESARRRAVDPRTLSFTHALRVVRETIPLMRAAAPALLPALYEAMLALIGQGRLPPRDHRINPRVIKVKMSRWKKKRPEHYKPPRPQKTFANAVVMLK